MLIAGIAPAAAPNTPASKSAPRAATAAP